MSWTVPTRRCSRRMPPSAALSGAARDDGSGAAGVGGARAGRRRRAAACEPAFRRGLRRGPRPPSGRGVCVTAWRGPRRPDGWRCGRAVGERPGNAGWRRGQERRSPWTIHQYAQASRPTRTGRSRRASTARRPRPRQTGRSLRRSGSRPCASALWPLAWALPRR